MAELPTAGVEPLYKVFSKENTDCDKNILRLIAEAYGLSSQLSFAPVDQSENDFLFSVILKVYQPAETSESASSPITEGGQGLQAIIDIFARDYKSKTASPGRKNRQTLDHPWYFAGYRTIKDRISKLMRWCCVDFVESIKDQISLSTASRSIPCLPADILKLGRILKMHTFVAIEKITLPDFVCFVLSHAFLELCVELNMMQLLYDSLAEILHFVKWFNVMQERPEVVRLRLSSNGTILRKLSITEAPLWPSSMAPFEDVANSILQAQRSVRNCVTDKTSRKEATAKAVLEKTLVNEGTTFHDIHDKLTRCGWAPRYDDNDLLDTEIVVPWDQLPAELDPASGGLNPERARKKRRQIDNLVRFARCILKDGSKVVDFCGGGGHLAIVFGWMFPHVEVHLVDRNAVHLALAQKRITKLEASGVHLTNVHIHKKDIRDWDMMNFDLGMAIHSCGVLCDIVQELCIRANAAYLIVPCCFGSLKNNNSTSDVRVPRSDKWSSAFGLVKHEYNILCSVADRGSESWKIEAQERQDARLAMAIIDEDRQQRAREAGYSALFHLTLQPPTITPKNEVIIGLPNQFAFPPTFTSLEQLPTQVHPDLTVRPAG
eukprot:TRINITY_DN6794_c0_g1_i1.p1 TRINITY_DN6794_c0_g1~~TRINITY_DN6794_c0_g1_i1.p1  ORF type:complete len:627 (-),score=65.28 TRINITY_DN6794_c0_g1_i1:8-1822(-)